MDDGETSDQGGRIELRRIWVEKIRKVETIKVENDQEKRIIKR